MPWKVGDEVGELGILINPPQVRGGWWLGLRRDRCCCLLLSCKKMNRPGVVNPRINQPAERRRSMTIDRGKQGDEPRVLLS